MSDLEQALARNWWHLVAHETELAAPGDWVRLDWPLGELVLMNDGGRLLAFDNVCPHRGGRFFTGSAGNGAAICPYHAWRIRDGAVRVARPDLFKACDLEKATLNTFQIERLGGWLFVGDAPVRSLAAQLDGLAEPLAAMGADVARRFDLLDQPFGCDWRVAAENALESYHVAPIHGSSLGTLGLTDETWDFHGANCDYRARVGASRMAKGLTAMRRFFDVREGFDGYRSLHVFPYAMVSSTFGYSTALQTFFPSVAGGDCRFVSRMLAARVQTGAEPAVEAFLASSARMNRQVFEEDRIICERVSPLYDLDAPDRIFASNEARVERFAATLRALSTDTAADRHRKIA